MSQEIAGQIAVGLSIVFALTLILQVKISLQPARRRRR